MKLLSEKFPETFELLKIKKDCPFCKSPNVISELQKPKSTTLYSCSDCESTGYKNSDEEYWTQKYGNGTWYQDTKL